MEEKKKSREQIEKERQEFLDLQKQKQDLEDPLKKPAQRISGWNSKLRSAKEKIKRDRMDEKLTITRKRTP